MFPIDGLKIKVNNQDVKQIINVCFKLGHRIQLSDHKCNHVTQ